jgi:hypothetical protein
MSAWTLVATVSVSSSEMFDRPHDVQVHRIERRHHQDAGQEIADAEPGVQEAVMYPASMPAPIAASCRDDGRDVVHQEGGADRGAERERSVGD